MRISSCFLKHMLIFIQSDSFAAFSETYLDIAKNILIIDCQLFLIFPRV
jgi:hypothetical protein